MEKIHSLLSLLDLSTKAREVYLCLLSLGDCTARTLSLRLNLSRPSVYDQLKILINLGLVIEKDLDGTKLFTPGDLSIIERLLEEKRQKLERGKQELIELLPTIQKASSFSSPRIRFVEGADNLSRLLYELLFLGGKQICTVWPYREMSEIVGLEFLEKFNKERVRKNISLLALWPEQSRKDKTIFSETDKKDPSMQRRYCGKGFSPKMSYTICGNQVFCVSSKKEMFGFVVDSSEFAELMKMQFTILWDSSRR